MKYEKGTFVTVPNIQALQILPPASQALFMWLCSYADADGSCFPSRALLAENLKCSVRAIDTHLAKLVEEGFIEKENRFKDNKKTSNAYQILLVSSADSAHTLAQNLPIPRADSAHRTKPTEPNPKELKKHVSEKHPYGEFKNVRLSDEDKEKLKNLYGVANAKKLVEALSIYKKSKGREYVNDYATLLGFARRDKMEVIQEKPKPKAPEPETVLTPEQQEKIRQTREAITKKLARK